MKTEIELLKTLVILQTTTINLLMSAPHVSNETREVVLETLAAATTIIENLSQG